MHREPSLRRHIAPWLLLMPFALTCSCSVTPAVIEGDAAGSALPSATELILLTPAVNFEHVANKELTPEQHAGVNELATWIQGIAEEELRRKGLSVRGAAGGVTGMGQEGSTGEDKADLCRKLVLSSIDTSMARELAHRVCTGGTNSAVLAHTLRVKIGQQRSTDLVGLPPLYIGVVQRVGMCSSYLRVAIRDCATGRILWANSVLFRDLPRMDDPDFEAAIRQLYGRLSTKGE